MTCKCTTAERDPDCTIDHTLSEVEAQLAFGSVGVLSPVDIGSMTPEEVALGALDALLDAVGKLPLNQITTRPPLHKAVMRGLTVVDLAVKEGRYDATDTAH